jgi:hypothetical protein
MAEYVDEAKTAKLIDYLVGTCNSLDNGIFVVGIPEDQVDYAMLDEAIFCCEECNWWSETWEMSTAREGYCSECQDDLD